jgi:hypothetical protein
MRIIKLAFFASTCLLSANTMAIDEKGLKNLANIITIQNSLFSIKMSTSY